MEQDPRHFGEGSQREQKRRNYSRLANPVNQQKVEPETLQEPAKLSSLGSSGEPPPKAHLPGKTDKSLQEQALELGITQLPKGWGTKELALYRANLERMNSPEALAASEKWNRQQQKLREIHQQWPTPHAQVRKAKLKINIGIEIVRKAFF